VIVMTRGQKEALQFEFQNQRNQIVMLSELAGNGEVDIPDPSMNGFSEYGEILADLHRKINQAFPEIMRRASLKNCNSSR